MRLLSSLMATIGKAATPSLGRPRSGQAVRGLKAENRGLQSNSSPVYKTQSETSILSRASNGLDRGVNRVRRLSTGPGMKPIKSLDDVSKLLKNEEVKNIVVVAGAGISTPSGIPDFRTPGTGLYDNLQQYRIPYPEAIFDIDYFHHNPKPFFTLAKELYPSGKYRPNYIHYFIRKLYDKGMLLRMYTQNIDGLERLAGLPPEKLVEAHGTFSSATCMICGSRKEGSEVKTAIFKDRLPKCLKRGCPGIVKPDIVFFGEDLPQRFYLYLRDMLQTDLVIVMGTSLEVQPFAGIIDTVQYSVPRVLFNWNAVGPFRAGKRSQDVVATGDLISSTQKFAEMISWKSEIDELIIQSEGSLLICSPEYTKQAANKPRPTKAQPITNAFWRNNVESSSEESSESETESSSESSSEEETNRYKSESFRRRGVRSTGSMKNNMGTATIKNGNSSNRLLNNSKKNGITNSNGQKRDFTTRTLNTRSPAPNSTFSARSEKNITGRNGISVARPPTGKFGNGKLSSLKPLSSNDKTRNSEKLIPLSNKTRVFQGKTPDVSGNNNNTEKVIETETKPVSSSEKVVESDLNVSAAGNSSEKVVESDLNVSAAGNSSEKVVESDLNVSASGHSVLSPPKSEISINKTANLSDSMIPSLERTVESSHKDKLFVKSQKKDALVSNFQDENKTLPSLVDSVKEDIKKLTLTEETVTKTGKMGASHDVALTNKQPEFTGKISNTCGESVNSINEKVKDITLKSVKEISPIKTVKSDSALGSLSSRKKNVNESSTVSSKLDNGNKSGKARNSEKIKRSASEKNLRKKEKKEKKRSASAKAKVNLRLLHNRYAKSEEDKIQSNKTDNIGQSNLESMSNEQPYVNLIGTLKREKPIDVGLNITNIFDKSQHTDSVVDTGNSNMLFNSDNDIADREEENIEDIDDKFRGMSLNQTVPDNNNEGKDSDRDKDLHWRRLHKKFSKRKRKSNSKELNTLNPVPYGYATPRNKRLTNRAMIPANVCSGYELPSENVDSELMRKFASPTHVKLAYRHSLKSTSSIGTRIIEDSISTEIIEKKVDICQS